MSSVTQFTRKPYTGSCHCGHVKYIVYLSLPALPYPKTTPTEFRKRSGHRIYKCNCTMCHKGGILHIRALDATNDFFVISPENPTEKGSGLKSYVPEGSTRWLFCEFCGVRSFTLRGTGYTDEIDLPSALLQRLNSRTLNGTAGEIEAKDGDTTRVSVWRPSKDWRENKDKEGDEDEDEDEGEEEAEDGERANYLSINGVTLDAHNENLDLGQLYENGYVAYMQTLEFSSDFYQDTPYFGGTY